MAALLLNDGTGWEPDPADVIKWTQLYPAVDVHQEINAMAGWLDANPSKRKTPRGVKRFVNAWLSRAQDKGGSGLGLPKYKKTNTRDMSIEDELTDVSWLDHDPEMRERMKLYYLANKGQYFHNGERFTE